MNTPWFIFRIENTKRSVLDSFPNIYITYIILLTILVTVATVEKSFSKLKLLKSYIKSAMLQDR